MLARDIDLLFIHRSGSEELGNIPRREETRESGQDTLLFAVTPFSRFLGLPMVFSPFQSFSSINNERCNLRKQHVTPVILLPYF